MAEEKNGKAVEADSKSKELSDYGFSESASKRPDLEKNKFIAEADYSLNIATGETKYGGPPPNWEEDSGCEFKAAVKQEVEAKHIMDMHNSIKEIKKKLKEKLVIATAYYEESLVMCQTQFNSSNNQQSLLQQNIKKTPTSVYVGGLGCDVEKGDLVREFSKFGTLNKVWVAHNPPGFAFIEFENDQDANVAIKYMNSSYMKGYKIRVNLSHGSGRGRRGSDRGRGRGRGQGGSNSGFRGRIGQDGGYFRGGRSSGRDGGYEKYY